MADQMDDDDTDEDEYTDAPVREGRMARLERALAPKAPVTPSGGTPTKWSVDRLDGRERLYCYGLSGVAVIFTLLIYVGETTEKHFHPIKGQFSPSTALIVGFTSAAALAITTWVGRRALVGFVSLFAFLGFENSTFLIGVPFLVLAVWLLYRSYKVQKAATAQLRAARSDSGGTTTARRPRSAAAPRKTAAETRAERKKAAAGPESNKRYTPKKPAPKPIPAPKPSWRERREAKASD